MFDCILTACGAGYKNTVMKTNTDKRTKGEWQTFIQPSDRGLVSTINVGSKRIATLEHLSIEETEANAAFIVKAVNNYDRLVEALQKMMGLAERLQDAWAGCNKYQPDSRAYQDPQFSPDYTNAKQLLNSLEEHTAIQNTQP